jgi:Glycosyltransferase family 87
VTVPGRSSLAWRAIFVAALALCWASAGSFPFRIALRELRTPNDFTHDYVRAAVWVRKEKLRHLPALDTGAGNDYAATLGAPRVAPLGSYYIHPPAALLLILPLTAFPYSVAALVWLALTVVLLVFLAWLLAPFAAGAGVPLRAGWLFLLLLFWPPVLANLRVGQWSVILAVSIAAGHRAWERGAQRRGAVWMGVAAALKLSPLALLPVIALRNRRAALSFAAAMAVLVAASLPVFGLEAWRAFAVVTGPNAMAYQTWRHNTLSVNGLATRLFWGGAFAQPIVAAPALAYAVVAAVVGVLVIVALLAARRAPKAREPEACMLALWYVLMVVANPLAWSHYAILLLLPMALAARGAAARNDAPARVLVAVGLALLSIPQETLDFAAGPVPISPLGCLWLSIPLGGALFVFAAAARGAFPSPARAPR